MDDQTVYLHLGQRALLTALMLASPVLGFGLLTGVVISLIQAVTSIHEMTLTFVPKIIVIAAALIFFSPWMSVLIIDFTREILVNIPNWLR